MGEEGITKIRLALDSYFDNALAFGPYPTSMSI
jgi:hypothetical protein